MPRRHPLPRLWLMTDERQGDALWPALEKLPRGSGVVARHYDLGTGERRALIREIATIADRRGLLLAAAGPERFARAVRADGHHERSARPSHGALFRTMSVHDEAELVTAHRAGADLVFASPVFTTASHPGGRGLGRLRLARLVRQSRVPVVALGGMTHKRAQALRGTGIYGWAAIGALTP